MPSFILPDHSLSRRQLLGVTLACFAVFLACLLLLGSSYWYLLDGHIGDNYYYLVITEAIRSGDYSGEDIRKLFWGLPYVMTVVATITGLPDYVALAAICISASLIGVALCHELWGGWVAAWFVVLCWEWQQLSLLGGAEPLATTLLLGCFLALRKSHWRLAALLGALATVVRPFGVFALVGLGLQLLYQRRYRDFAIATTIALAIGGLYMWPLQQHFGNPLLNVSNYQQNDWGDGIPFYFPFVAILQNTWPINGPIPALVFSWSCILLVLFALVITVRSGDFRHYLDTHTGETCFVMLYCLALFTYNAPEWARAVFPRYALPVTPWIVFLLRRYLPQDARWLWSLAIVSPICGVVYTLGIHHTREVLLGYFSGG